MIYSLRRATALFLTLRIITNYNYLIFLFSHTFKFDSIHDILCRKLESVKNRERTPVKYKGFPTYALKQTFVQKAFHRRSVRQCQHTNQIVMPVLFLVLPFLGCPTYIEGPLFYRTSSCYTHVGLYKIDIISIPCIRQNHLSELNQYKYAWGWL